MLKKYWPKRRTFRIVRPNGEIRWIEGNISMKTYLGNECCISINRDITERKHEIERIAKNAKLEMAKSLKKNRRRCSCDSKIIKPEYRRNRKIILTTNSTNLPNWFWLHLLSNQPYRTGGHLGQMILPYRPAAR